MKKISLVLALVLALSCFLVSCDNGGGIKVDGSQTTASASTGDGSQAASGATRTVKDFNDKVVTIPESVEAVVSLSPVSTLAIKTYDATSLITGADKYSASLVSGLKTVEESDYSKIDADVVFADEFVDTSKIPSDITIITIPAPEAIVDVKTALEVVGNVIGKSTSTIEDTQKSFVNLVSTIQNQSGDFKGKSSVFIDLGKYGDDNYLTNFTDDGKNGEIITIGGGTLIEGILESAGGESVFKDTDGYMTKTESDIVTANPDFIFTTGEVNDYLKNDAFAKVTAVVKKQVVHIDAETVIYSSSDVSTAVQNVFEAISNARSAA